MPLPSLIGFAGRAGAGKTTAACTVCAEFPGYVRLSFASPLRDMLRVLGISDEDMSAGKESPHPLLCGRSPRFALQHLGTEWGRQMIGPELWVGVALHLSLIHI